MPVRPPRPCTSPGCPHLVVRGSYCELCTATRVRTTQASTRPSADSRGYGAAWQRYRARYLALHPLCRDPFDRHPGVLMPARQVDHIIAHKGNATLFNDPNNHQPLCAGCGAFKSAVEPGGRSHRPHAWEALERRMLAKRDAIIEGRDIEPVDDGRVHHPKVSTRRDTRPGMGGRISTTEGPLTALPGQNVSAAVVQTRGHNG